MRSPAGMLPLATWTLLVVPSGMKLIGPDMSNDMHLYAVSWETTGSDEPDTWLWA